MKQMARVNRKALRQLRVGQGYSQEEVARMADISLRRYVDIETKSSGSPTLATLAAIAKALNVRVADIIIDYE